MYHSKVLANIQRELSDFLHTYRNVPNSMTHLAPAHLIMAKAPCAHLAMTHPSVANRVMQQLVPHPSETLSKVRKFGCGDSVMVCDFVRCLLQSGVHGEFTYQVDCEGYLR